MSYDNPYEKCAEMNAAMTRSDVKWVVSYGKPELVDCAEWSARHAKWMRSKYETERDEALGRSLDPVQTEFENGDPWK